MVAIAPNGVVFVLETKAKTYDARHLARARQQGGVGWSSSAEGVQGRRAAGSLHCASSVIERCEGDVLVFSIDRLISTLSVVANETASDCGMRLGGLVA